jgi:tyrosinase
MGMQALAHTAPAPAQVKLRRSVTQMSPAELARFQNAMAKFIARPDNKGFQYFANWHGVAFDICQHHNDLFLPWHRGYLYHFELALQDIDSGVTVPWWNWFDETGIPAAYTDTAHDNPLLGAPISPVGTSVDPSWPTETGRDPGAPGPGPRPVAPPLRSLTVGGKPAYDWLMGSPSYKQFEERCWQLHDNIHDWVGGTMSDQNWAAYDPLFWAHHSMVDRLWRIWQHNNPSALPTSDLLDTAMTFATAPSLKVREVLDVNQLGYDYAAQTATATATA